jgi:predicted GTPase
MDAKSPAKEADRDMLEKLADWHAAHPQFKPAPLIGVATKIDTLSPLMEWEPPYDWQRPQRPKEEHIAGALDYIRELFGHRLETVVPVCTDRDRGRVYGITEHLIPAMTALLPEARAVSLIKTLHADQLEGRYSQLLTQAVSAGRQMVDVWRTMAAKR